jgi:uncharacterized protein (DUF488 family)
MNGIVSVGYEGTALAQFIQSLLDRQVEVLVDVRLNAISRRHGFSKSALSAALAEAGIEYKHFRARGNPKSNRASFAGPDRPAGRARYRALLEEAAAQQALAELDELRRNHVTAVLCFERDEEACHRHVILRELDHRVRLAS